MELKSENNSNNSWNCNCLNRTFMELKFNSFFIHLNKFLSLNRTFMELKYVASVRVRICKLV